MSWTEILIEVPLHQAELLSDTLIDAGALSVSVEDADQGTEAEQPLFGEPGITQPGGLGAQPRGGADRCRRRP